MRKMGKMRWKILALATLLTLLTVTPIWAESLLVDVKGLVCSFCAYSLEKKFGKNSKVKSVKVDLDKKQVYIETKKGERLSDQEVRNEVKNSGYLVDKITRK